MSKNVQTIPAESLLTLYFNLSSRLIKQLLSGSFINSILSFFEKLSVALVIQSNVFTNVSNKEPIPSGLANYFHVS
jgi:hypothetical protein